MSVDIGMSKTISLVKSEMEAARASEKVGGFNRQEFDKGEIKKVAEQFESLFLDIVMKAMRDSVHKSGLIDGGNAEEIYGSMLDQEYTKQMASQRQTGLADNIEEFLLRSYGDQAAADAVKAASTTGKTAGLKAYQAQGLQPEEKQARMKSAQSPQSEDLIPPAASPKMKSL